MAGEPYAAGGIRTTVAATRTATDDDLRSNVARHVAEMGRQGTTTVEIGGAHVGIGTFASERILVTT